MLLVPARIYGLVPGESPTPQTDLVVSAFRAKHACCAHRAGKTCGHAWGINNEREIDVVAARKAKTIRARAAEPPFQPSNVILSARRCGSARNWRCRLAHLRLASHTLLRCSGAPPVDIRSDTGKCIAAPHLREEIDLAFQSQKDDAGAPKKAITVQRDTTMQPWQIPETGD